MVLFPVWLRAFFEELRQKILHGNPLISLFTLLAIHNDVNPGDLVGYWKNLHQVSFCPSFVVLSVQLSFPLLCRWFSSEEHLEVLYSSLVKTSLGREDVANLEKENVKNSHEVKQTFRNASKAYKSYLYRTSLELVAGVILIIFFLSYGDIKGLARPLFDCDVHSILFKCVIPNSRFYYVSLSTKYTACWSCMFCLHLQAVYMIGFTLLLAYISLTGYNLLWLVHPKVGKLERILSGCRKRSKNALDSPSKSNDGIPEIRLEMYYDKKGKDFSLLMQLLAEQSSGLSQAFRILCVFDKHFQRLWKPRDNKVVVQRPLINTFTLDPQDKGKRARIIAIFNAGVLERQVFFL